MDQTWSIKFLSVNRPNTLTMEVFHSKWLQFLKGIYCILYITAEDFDLMLGFAMTLGFWEAPRDNLCYNRILIVLYQIHWVAIFYDLLFSLMEWWFWTIPLLLGKKKIFWWRKCCHSVYSADHLMQAQIMVLPPHACSLGFGLSNLLSDQTY